MHVVASCFTIDCTRSHRCKLHSHQTETSPSSSSDEQCVRLFLSMPSPRIRFRARKYDQFDRTAARCKSLPGSVCHHERVCDGKNPLSRAKNATVSIQYSHAGQDNQLSYVTVYFLCCGMHLSQQYELKLARKGGHATYRHDSLVRCPTKAPM